MKPWQEYNGDEDELALEQWQIQEAKEDAAVEDYMNGDRE